MTVRRDQATNSEVGPGETGGPDIVAALTQPLDQTIKISVDEIDADPAIGKLVLFGGLMPGQGLSAETWTFDGTTWTLLHPATRPSKAGGASISFLETGAQPMILHIAPASTPPIATLPDTGLATPPPTPIQALIAVDPNKGSILFCGSRQSGLFRSEDSGASWQRVA